MQTGHKSLPFVRAGAAESEAAFPWWDLLLAWTGRRLRSRYQQSALGWLWALVQPIAQVAIFTLIFTVFIPLDTGEQPYAVFAYVAIVAWALGSTALVDMSESIVENMSLVTKIYFPREVLPISALCARLMDFAVASSLIVFLLLLYGQPISTANMWAIPLILAVHLALILGIGLACAATNVFYRDVKPALTLILQIWFYLSPVVYPVSRVPEHLAGWYNLNPMVGILGGYRAVWLGDPVPWPALQNAAPIAALALFGGYALFKWSEAQFADVV